MLCSSMSVEGWSGVELPLAGLILALFMRNTFLVDSSPLLTLDALTPIFIAFSPIDWIVSLATYNNILDSKFNIITIPLSPSSQVAHIHRSLVTMETVFISTRGVMVMMTVETAVMRPTVQIRSI